MRYDKPSPRFYGIRPTNVYPSLSGRRRSSSDVLCLPVVYICKKCGHELYRFSGMAPPFKDNAALTPKEVAWKTYNICPNPKCRAPLDEKPDIDLANIKVISVD